MPRKTRLTPEVQQQICSYVNGGAPIPEACLAAGIPWDTCKDWLKKGKAGKAPYADFVAAVKMAKAQWVAATAMRVTKAGKDDWRAAAWLLERRVDAFKPPRQQLEHSGKDGKPIEMKVAARESLEAKLNKLAEKRKGKDAPTE